MVGAVAASSIRFAKDRDAGRVAVKKIFPPDRAHLALGKKTCNGNGAQLLLEDRRIMVG